jgi:hypothetical protein
MWTARRASSSRVAAARTPGAFGAEGIQIADWFRANY